MADLFLRFPNGLMKALTLSYDDGTEQDVQLVEIMNRYGLKGTFNLNGGQFAPEGTTYPQGQIHRRMTEKELITYHTEGRTKVFRAAVSREDVVAQETDSLLERAYRGSIGMMLSAMVSHKNLSKADIDELYAILKEAEEDAK